MSFQAYIDNIKAKTGKTPEDFEIIARRKGLLEPGVKTGQIVEWLKKDFGLGHGHAMAIVVTLQRVKGVTLSRDERLEKHFSGKKAVWRETYQALMASVNKFGGDVSASPTNTYISILRGGKKFAIAAITSGRFDVGIKLKGAKPTRRFEEAGEWNSMVTHRVTIADSKGIDSELLKWLRQAYEKAHD